LSAEAERDRIAAVREAGADGYLVKPFSALNLKAAIAEIFGA
jgi:DNA-binding response OmpR family regulator